MIDAFLNPAKTEITENLKKESAEKIKKFFMEANTAAAFPNLFKLLWNSYIPCFKNDISKSYLLKKCKWQGLNRNCSELFQQVPTDSGTEKVIYRFEFTKIFFKVYAVHSMQSHL